MVHRKSSAVMYSRILDRTFGKYLRTSFVVLACHSQVLDVFNGHFQASVHFTVSSAVNKTQQYKNSREIFLGNAIKPDIPGQVLQKLK